MTLAGMTSSMLWVQDETRAVKDGELSAGATDQELVSGRAAFGIRSDGSGFLVVDKPVGSPSDGVTLKKLGQIMRGYGAVDAVNWMAVVLQP